MNARGRKFSEGVTSEDLYRIVFASKKQLGDLFQQLCRERYEVYKLNMYSYEDFYHCLIMRLKSEGFNDIGATTNVYMDFVTLRRAIKILDVMFPKGKQYPGEEYYLWENEWEAINPDKP